MKYYIQFDDEDVARKVITHLQNRCSELLWNSGHKPLDKVSVYLHRERVLEISNMRLTVWEDIPGSIVRHKVYDFRIHNK